MNLNDVHRGVRKNRPRKRLGRGPGTGHGKTAGRGHKGQRSRAGASFNPAFEGGQMPLARRIPKRGFNNRWAAVVAEVNLDQLEQWFENGEEVSPAALKSKGKLRGRYDLLKVLGRGELTKKLKVSAHRFSKTARERIAAAGGEVVELPTKKPVPKNKQKSQESAS